MAIIISQGSGATVATESISGQHYGYNKITDASLGGSATVGMIVDSSGNASGAAHVFIRGNVTINSVDPKGFIGLATVTGNVGVTGNVTLTDSKAFIGLVTIGGMSTVTLADPKGYIGLVSVSQPLKVTGNAGGVFDVADGGTAPANSIAIGIKDDGGSLNLWQSPSAQGDANNAKKYAAVGGMVFNGTTYDRVRSISLGIQGVGVVGNVTLADSKGFIGLVTIVDARPLLTSTNTVAGYISTSSGYPQLVTPQFQSGNRWAETGTGIGQVAVIGNVTLSDPKGYIGLVTVTGGISFSGNVTLDPGSKTGISGNVTISDSKGFIGLVTIGGISTVTLSDPKGFIGLVSVSGFANPLPVSFSGNVTLDAGSKTAIVGNVTLSDPKTFIGSVSVGGIVDSKGFIGLVTLGGGTAWADPKGYIGLVTITGALNAAAGNVTLDAGSKTGIVGNVTLSDSKGFIGLVTVGGISTITLADPKGYIGLVTVGGIGTVTLADPKGFIGLTTTVDARPLLTSTSTVAGYISTSTGYPQLVTLQFQSGNRVGETGTGILNVAPFGNVTLSDSKGFIGLTTTVNSQAWPDPKTFIGLVTIGGHSTMTLADPKGFIGLVTIGGMSTVTLADPKGYIGLVTVGGIGTVTLADPKGFIGLVTIVPTFLSGYTALATIISAVGVATIIIPPSGQKIFVKNIHISSLGRGEIGLYRANIATATAAVIPWTSLSTTSGFTEFYGDSGQQWGLADDGLTAVINGSTATIGIGITCRFA